MSNTSSLSRSLLPVLCVGWLWAIVAVAGGLPVQAQGVCGVPALGDPCMLGGVASAGATEPVLSLGAGNPVHLGTGNKYQREIDLPPHPLAPALELVRHYNATSPRHGVLGRGWTLSYDTRLSRSGQRLRIVQADGSHIDFPSAPGAPTAGSHGVLRREAQGWAWRWPSGRVLWFDTEGRLVRLDHARGGTTVIHRSAAVGPLANTIERITAPNGQKLTFHYRVNGDSAYLDRVDTRHGAFRYQYAKPSPDGALQLVAVVRPDGMQRRYLHEADLQAGNPHALTGIAISNALGTKSHRLNTWAYDPQGRTIMFSAGGAGRENGATRPDGPTQIRYDRPASAEQDGMTTVLNADGGLSRYRIGLRGGRHVLLESDGPGCAGCPPTGQRASYDDDGRLTRLNDAELARDEDGTLRRLRPGVPGWPGLALHYPGSGKRHAWSSSLTGQERLDYTPRGLLRQRVFANEDSILYDYDAQGRPRRITSTAGDHSEVTTLRWKGSVPVRIEHPNETETRQYDDRKRLRVRAVQRASAQPGTTLRYSESFEYDRHDRLTVHHLPEGGALRYRWGSGQTLQAITWQPESGEAQAVIETVPGLAGYRYANGLHLHVAAGQDGHARQWVVSSPTTLLTTVDLRHDAAGRLLEETHTMPGRSEPSTLRYAYDSENRLVAHQPDAGEVSWLAWNEDGSLAAARTASSGTHRPDIQRGPSGLPRSVQGRSLYYGPNRRLQHVSTGERVLAEYRHNAFGYRIIKRSPAEHVNYFYLGNRVVAEQRLVSTAAHATAPAAQPAGRLALSRRYIYAHNVLVGFIDYTPGEPQPATLYAVHADAVGAATMVTDARQKLRWSARYGASGAAQDIRGDMRFDLRLPGQVFDIETGWHDNVLRTYAPAWGHYLEPDPLGPIPGQQALGYARQQARRYIDPMGLLLFAFDGTRLSSDTRSNVWKLSQAYADGPSHYHAGPGNSLYVDWDAVTAWQASRIIDTQWQFLLNGLHQASGTREHIPIDIIGFSRGAALARHFGNLVVERTQGRLFSYDDPVRGAVRTCVDLRFMGLFDTVAQFGLAGSHNGQYDLTIAAAWDWVAHAVALNERRWLYPVSSIGDAASANVVEAPFIGAHADIGGGTLYDDDGQPLRRGDLSDVALNWMLWQARAATADFRLSDTDDREISEPILHDERNAILRSVQDGDRSVLDASGSKLHAYQDDHARLGRRLRASAEALIARHDDWRSQAGPEVGTVDLHGYARWLYEELGWGAQPGSAAL